MSLGIAFKGPEGIVLAADSRVTLLAERQPQRQLIPATFDNATKLLRVASQDFVGVVTYGLGALGQREPRTAHSFIPEFEATLAADESIREGAGPRRLAVDDFAKRLSDFFMHQWGESMPSAYQGEPMVFLVAGYDERDAYGRVFEFAVPHRPWLIEKSPDSFGVTWGGQVHITNRIIQGFDPRLVQTVKEHLGLTDEQATDLTVQLARRHSLPIPYQFLPLQDCVDLSVFLIRTTMELQTWQVDVRGVGGAIDVTTITRTKGFQPVVEKEIRGEPKWLRWTMI